MSGVQELSRPTILVADDSPQNIELLSRVLGQEFRIKVATSGEKALKLVYSDEPPDLILLDIMMPDLSGHEVCRRIKANPDRRQIPVIPRAEMLAELMRLRFSIAVIVLAQASMADAAALRKDQLAVFHVGLGAGCDRRDAG